MKKARELYFFFKCDFRLHNISNQITINEFSRKSILHQTCVYICAEKQNTITMITALSSSACIATVVLSNFIRSCQEVFVVSLPDLIYDYEL